ncbi:MAG: PQQ-binding-like beta-propeller repeat protein [Prevotellaceae bacterium]|jgi:outer membrane protein assembly factor BamB|nr:PQQ-binding-like beta-propeller repeat protein [Prevotellaceae bacterium]
MKKFLTFGLVCVSASVFAQKATPDWSFPLEGTPQGLFIHKLSEIPVVETSKFYYGVNYVDKSVLWKIEKSAKAEVLNQVAQLSAMTGAGLDVPVTQMFQEIPNTSFVSINNLFVDVSTGKILFGEGESAYSEILEINIVPETFVLLAKVKSSGGAVTLYCIDLAEKELLWNKLLEKESTLKSLTKFTGFTGLGTIDAFAPKATSTEDIVYKNGKKLFLLNWKDGSTIWENECNPGTFFLDKKEQYLIVVEQAGGLGSLVKGASFGKEIFALDLKTGQNLWKKPTKLDGRYIAQIPINDEQALIISEDGINVYRYLTGEKVWKKTYETKKLKDIIVREDGFEVFYGNKTMLVDKATGKGVWKKPFEMDIPEDDEGSVTKQEYEKGFLVWGFGYVGFFDKTKGKAIWKLGVDKNNYNLAFDNVNNKVAVLDGKKLYIFKPDEQAKKPEKLKLDIKEPAEITGFETRDNGYFIQGFKEYFFLNVDGSMAEHQVFKQLNAEAGKKSLLLAGAIASSVLSTELVVTNTQTGEEVYRGGLFSKHSQEFGEISDAQIDAYRKLKNEAKLRGASQGTDDFAYFVTGQKVNDQDEMSLIKIDKNSGKEAGTFDLGNNRKIYYQLIPSLNMAFVVVGDQLAVFNL